MALAATAVPTRQPIYLREMMRRLGIDPAGDILPEACLNYYTALHRCQTCPCQQACRGWLDQAPAAVSAPPRFCPSADILFELQFDRLHH